MIEKIIFENGIKYFVSYYNPRKGITFIDSIGVEETLIVEDWSIIDNRGNRVYSRENGPAVIFKNERKEYWLRGVYFPNVNSPEELLISNIIE